MLVGAADNRPRTLEELLAGGLYARLDRIDVLSRKVFEGKLHGERRSKRRGRSVEFADFRPYTPGDELRHVDWNVFARLDKLFIKLFVAEEDLSLKIVVDRSASMGAGRHDKLVFCQRLATALGYIGLVNNNRVSAWAFGSQPPARLPEMRGRRSVRRLADFILGELVPETGSVGGGERSFADAMRLVAAGGGGRRGVIVLLSDMLFPEGFEEGLRMLAGARGHDVYCLQVLAPEELAPEEAEGGAIAGDLRMIDVETGAGKEVTVSAALLRQYKRRVEDYTHAVASYCAARRMTHALVRSDADVETLVFDQLRRRGLLR